MSQTMREAQLPAEESSTANDPPKSQALVSQKPGEDDEALSMALIEEMRKAELQADEQYARALQAQWQAEDHAVGAGQPFASPSHSVRVSPSHSRSPSLSSESWGSLESESSAGLTSSETAILEAPSPPNFHPPASPSHQPPTLPSHELPPTPADGSRRRKSEDATSPRAEKRQKLSEHDTRAAEEQEDEEYARKLHQFHQWEAEYFRVGNAQPPASPVSDAPPTPASGSRRRKSEELESPPWRAEKRQKITAENGTAPGAATPGESPSVSQHSLFAPEVMPSMIRMGTTQTSPTSPPPWPPSEPVESNGQAYIDPLLLEMDRRQELAMSSAKDKSPLEGPEEGGGMEPKFDDPAPGLVPWRHRLCSVQERINMMLKADPALLWPEEKAQLLDEARALATRKAKEAGSSSISPSNKQAFGPSSDQRPALAQKLDAMIEAEWRGLQEDTHGTTWSKDSVQEWLGKMPFVGPVVSTGREKAVLQGVALQKWAAGRSLDEASCPTPWRHVTEDEEQIRLMQNADRDLLDPSEKALLDGYYAGWCKRTGGLKEPVPCLTPWRHATSVEERLGLMRCADPALLSDNERALLKQADAQRGSRPRTRSGRVFVPVPQIPLPDSPKTKATRIAPVSRTPLPDSPRPSPIIHAPVPYMPLPETPRTNPTVSALELFISPYRPSRKGDLKPPPLPPSGPPPSPRPRPLELDFSEVSLDNPPFSRGLREDTPAPQSPPTPRPRPVELHFPQESLDNPPSRRGLREDTPVPEPPATPRPGFRPINRVPPTEEDLHHFKPIPRPPSRQEYLDANNADFQPVALKVARRLATPIPVPPATYTPLRLKSGTGRQRLAKDERHRVSAKVALSMATGAMAGQSHQDYDLNRGAWLDRSPPPATAPEALEELDERQELDAYRTARAAREALERLDELEAYRTACAAKGTDAGSSGGGAAPVSGDLKPGGGSSGLGISVPAADDGQIQSLEQQKEELLKRQLVGKWGPKEEDGGGKGGEEADGDEDRQKRAMEESYARWQENKLGRDGQEILEQLDAVWGSPGKDNDGDWLEEDDEEEEDAEEKGGAEEEEGAEEMEEDVEGDEDSEGGEDAEGEEEQEAEVSRLFEKIKSLEHEKEQLLKQKELEEQRSTRKREEDGKGKEEDAEGEEGDGIELEDVPMIEIVEDIDGYKLTRKAYIDVAFRDPPGPWSRDFKLNRKIDRVEELAESPASHASKSPASASHTSDPEPSDGPGSLDMDEAKSP